MDKSNISAEDLEKYKQYTEEALPAVGQLAEKLKDSGGRLDFSPQSLKFIDKVLDGLVPRAKEVTNYEETKQVSSIELSDETKWLVVRASYYLALMCIKNWGARWELDKLKASPYYKAAVIVIPDKIFKIDPLRVVFASKANGKNLYDWYDRLDKDFKK